MHQLRFQAVLLLTLSLGESALAAGKAEHVVVIVWDGMRPDFITREHTPALYQLSSAGVNFQNHHSVYCTSTEVNGTAIATGNYPEHSGLIANRDYLPAIDPLNPVDTQNPDVIKRGDEQTGGHYLLRPTLAETLQASGKPTVVAGSKLVALLHDRGPRPDSAVSVTLFAGRTLPASRLRAIEDVWGPFPPDVDRASSDPNEPRDEWTTRALLGPLWSNGIPAYSLLWLSEPDFSQHAAGPGSPKALAALKSLDRKLTQVLAELDKRGARDHTDIFVVSDHGFSSVEKSVDVCAALQEAGFPAYRQFTSPPKRGDILVISEGGSVLFYVSGQDARTTSQLVDFLEQQDFAGVLFTRVPMPGTFTLAQVHIDSPHPPDIVLSMRWSPEKSSLGAPGLEFSDLGRNRGNHGSMSRFDVHNTLIGTGPDLKRGYVDILPTANTDLAPTIYWLLGVKPKRPLDGRVLGEALAIDAPRVGQPTTRKLETDRRGDHFVWHQYLQVSKLDSTVYLDEGNGTVTRGEQLENGASGVNSSPAVSMPGE